MRQLHLQMSSRSGLGSGRVALGSAAGTGSTGCTTHCCSRGKGSFPLNLAASPGPAPERRSARRLRASRADVILAVLVSRHTCGSTASCSLSHGNVTSRLQVASMVTIESRECMPKAHRGRRVVVGNAGSIGPRSAVRACHRRSPCRAAIPRFLR